MTYYIIIIYFARFCNIKIFVIFDRIVRPQTTKPYVIAVWKSEKYSILAAYSFMHFMIFRKAYTEVENRSANNLQRSFQVGLLSIQMSRNLAELLADLWPS